MRVIIAGSRSIPDYAIVSRAIVESGFEITKVISGHARGVDRLGELWARKHKIPIQTFIPDWDRHGKIAGHLRNAEMAKVADALILIWDGMSHGSASMLRIAQEKKLKVFVLEVH